MPQLLPKIHARGDAARLDAVLELVAFTARPHPLTVSLDELPRRIARVFNADVCSIYLLEGEDLVMRGNIGFESSTLGEIRLAVGEGITGQAVEYMRPISLDAAPNHASYRHFPSLGEERFPIFLAVPIPGPKGPLGALVLQRRGPAAFDRADVEMAAALTAPIAAIAERARLVDALSRRKPSEATPGAQRVILSGRTVVPGRALGAVYTLPRPSAHTLHEYEPASSGEELAKTLDRATRQLRRTIAPLQQDPRLDPQDQNLFFSFCTMLDDGRLRERILDLAARTNGLGQGLTRAGAEVLRAAKRSGDAFGIERAHHIAEVCETLALLAVPGPWTRLPRSAVLVGDQFTLCDLVLALRVHPAAIVLSEHAGSPMVRTFLSLVEVPAVIEVAALLRWASDSGIALVDGPHGLVYLNPSRAEVSSFRTAQKQERSNGRKGAASERAMGRAQGG